MNPNTNDLGTNLLGIVLAILVAVMLILALTGCTPPPCGKDIRYAPDVARPGYFAAYRIGENPYGSWTWQEINETCGGK